MKEIWKDIPRFEGYQASSFGRIRSIPRVIFRNDFPVFLKGLIFKQTIHTSGYYRVPIRVNGYTKYHYVHRLIAITFLGSIPLGYDIDHIDHCRTNNLLSNLRYITVKENRGIKGNKHAKKWENYT